MYTERIMCNVANTATPRDDRPYSRYVRRPRWVVYDDHGTLVKACKTEAEAREFMGVVPRDEDCIRCGTGLTSQDPATTTLGPRCTNCWVGR